MNENSNNAAKEDVYHSCVPDNVYPHQDKQIKTHLDWPETGSLPISEHNTPGYIAGAFHTLFPYGKADLRDMRDTDMTTSEYFKHLLRYEDERFAKHKTFRFFAYNSWMRWTALTDGHVFVKKNNKQFQNITVQKMKDMISENLNVLKKIMFHAKNLKGSKSYGFQEQEN